MIVINHRGRPVACVRPPFVEFAPQIAVLEADHPHRRWAFCLALFALDVAEGNLPGPYSDFRAAVFARQALIPAHEFEQLESYDDAVLAEHFNVPLGEIAEKRADLEAAACF